MRRIVLEETWNKEKKWLKRSVQETFIQDTISKSLWRKITEDVKNNSQVNDIVDLAYEFIDSFNKNTKYECKVGELHILGDDLFFEIITEDSDEGEVVVGTIHLLENIQRQAELSLATLVPGEEGEVILALGVFFEEEKDGRLPR